MLPRRETPPKEVHVVPFTVKKQVPNYEIKNIKHAVSPGTSQSPPCMYLFEVCFSYVFENMRHNHVSPYAERPHPGTFCRRGTVFLTRG